MAETTITADPMDISIKGNGVVDMHHSQLYLKSSKHSQANQSFDESSPEQQTNSAPCVDQSTLALAKSNYKNSNRNNNNNSPTNLSATNFRCERCDNFETSSRSNLLLHVVQCLSSPTRLKLEELDAENLIVNTGNVVVSHVEPPNNITNIGKNEMHCGLPNETLHNSNSQPNNNSSMNGGGSSSRKVFECDVCNMKFSNGANMRRHKMRHTGVKPYECRVCQKRFFRKDHLAEHFTTHTKTLPYHCPICNRGFQRQIAMRAHFQNEHVGQHDLVKTCPLCSYRAGSMKSLRIHFYNRHGIDLDNPGPGGSSSLLLALESQVSQAAAAAAAGFVPNLNAAAVASVVGNSGLSAPNHQSDSGESLRSTENSTPPMHFLTPHVEISMPENSGELFNGNSTVAGSDTVEPKHKESDTMSPPAVTNQGSLCTSPGLSQDQRMSCSTKFAPSSTINSLRLTASPKSNQYDNHIMPSISLIPIKQEPINEDLSCQQSNNLQEGNEEASVDNENDFFTTENKKMSSLIKISPLKSLLREDLKRRICAKANNRVTRNAAALENNNVIQSSSSTPISVLCNSTTSICNGTITSTGQETDSTMLNRKQILTCLFCGIEFPDETLYFLHKGCHCESNPWKCNICSEQCNNVYEFNSHLLSKSHQ